MNQLISLALAAFASASIATVAWLVPAFARTRSNILMATVGY